MVSSVLNKSLQNPRLYKNKPYKLIYLNDDLIYVVNLSSWKSKIEEEMELDSTEDEEAPTEIGSVETSKQDTGFYEFQKFKDGILTIGCVGQPNTGKSSLINALMGRKVRQIFF